jgi:phenylglyoxylate dehydrogenase epsilon subunit
MLRTEYLIIGSSHAGLSAAEEIRVNDPEGPLVMVTMEDLLPYSPTVLPYIVSGKVSPDQVVLRNESYFEEKKIQFLRERTVTSVDARASDVTLLDGEKINYKKLLIATGAEPVMPQVENLQNTPFLALRTMADALKHLDVLPKAKTCIVMGTGLVGMHAAENFVQRGLQVHVVRARAKKNPRILPNYFDEECARIIQDVFESHGVRFHLTNHAVRVTHQKGETAVTLHDGQQLGANILLVCTGMRPRTAFLTNGDVKVDEGILVDARMKTSVDNIWAAGDVARGDDFFSSAKVLNAILPDAVLQGKISGADMSGGQLGQEYEGGLSMNAFNFFGNHAFSVGMHSVRKGTAPISVNKTVLPSAKVYQEMVFQGDVLVGVSAINTDLDPGIVMNLIRTRAELKDEKAELVSNPINMTRRLMWKLWR